LSGKNTASSRCWFCVVKPGSWRFMKKVGLFGVGIKGSKQLLQAKPGDLLIVYSGSLKGGVIGICRISSEPFVSTKEVWSRSYPYRVSIQVISDFASSPVSMSMLLGQRDTGVEITPYLLGTGIIELRPCDKVLAFLESIKQESTARSSIDRLCCRC
jgi:hypothetical protein